MEKGLRANIFFSEDEKTHSNFYIIIMNKGEVLSIT